MNSHLMWKEFIIIFFLLINLNGHFCSSTPWLNIFKTTLFDFSHRTQVHDYILETVEDSEETVKNTDYTDLD